MEQTTIAMTEIERLVKVETRLTTVVETLTKIDQKLDILIPTFATGAQVTEEKAEREKQITEVKTDLEVKIVTIANDLESSKEKFSNDLDNAKKRSSMQNWITGLLGMVLGAVMALLIQAYFTS